MTRPEKTEEQKAFDKLIYRLYESFKESNDFVCILYTAISKNAFSEIADIKGFVSSCIIDSIYIRGKNSEEIQLYSWDKPTMRITDKNICITAKNKKIKIARQ